MIYIYYGEDREKAIQAAQKKLGEGYEVIDANDITEDDLTNIFFGQTLFDTHRRIMIKDFCANRTFRDLLSKFVQTPHEIAIIEQKIDTRLKVYKGLLRRKNVEFRKFEKPEGDSDRFACFGIYDEALRNGQRAVMRLRRTEKTDEETILFIGAWVSRATENFSKNPTDKNRRILKELARLDLLTKTSAFSSDPWPALETFLLRLKDL